MGHVRPSEVTFRSVANFHHTRNTNIPKESDQELCTCNDDREHDDMSTWMITTDGKTIKSCGTAVPTATSTSTTVSATLEPLPQNEPKCKGNKNDDATYTKEEVEKTIKKVCKELVDGGFKYDKASTDGWSEKFFSGKSLKDEDSKTSKSDKMILVEINLDQRACPNQNEFVVDFPKMGTGTCEKHMKLINEKCELAIMS